MHSGASITMSEKRGSALQREYAWRGEHCFGNNRLVKSLSPQAPCLSHLDLMAGVLSLLFYLQYLNPHPIILCSPTIYKPTLSICYFPLPLPPPRRYLTLTFSLLFLSILSEDFYCLLQLPILFPYRFQDFLTWHLYSLPPHLLWEQQVSLYFFTSALWLSRCPFLISPTCLFSI